MKLRTSALLLITIFIGQAVIFGTIVILSENELEINKNTNQEVNTLLKNFLKNISSQIQ